ncbi:hypothetical protein CRG98_037979 [Punica granatum]|uniref:Uncharacterized protein n=1 Tax=Punica granatum TaxID=22663 RepID=A0A2I0ICE8_PUNGR|nr:hypothetical protein CRG98_037979 [Punica granatum]
MDGDEDEDEDEVVDEVEVEDEFEVEAERIRTRVKISFEEFLHQLKGNMLFVIEFVWHSRGSLLRTWKDLWKLLGDHKGEINKARAMAKVANSDEVPFLELKIEVETPPHNNSNSNGDRGCQVRWSTFRVMLCLD